MALQHKAWSESALGGSAWTELLSSRWGVQRSTLPGGEKNAREEKGLM